MRNWKRNKSLNPVSQNDNLSTKTSNEFLPRLPSDYSLPIQSKGGKEDRVLSSLSCEVHLTVRPKVELSKKIVSLLLENFLLRVTFENFDLYSYLLIEWMNSYLRGNLDSDEVKFEKERQVIRLSDLTLLSMRNQEIPLGEKFPLNLEVQELIKEFLDPSGRKYSSRKIYYAFEKFLEVRAVPVSSIFEREKGTSIRYSSYCKGYGESSRMGRRKKTPPSFELDGITEDTRLRTSDISSLLNIQKYFRLNILEQKLRMKKT